MRPPRFSSNFSASQLADRTIEASVLEGAAHSALEHVAALACMLRRNPDPVIGVQLEWTLRELVRAVDFAADCEAARQRALAAVHSEAVAQ